VITTGALVWAVVATLGRTPRLAGGPTEMRVQIALGQEGFDTGLGSAVAFSPDGRRIAYVEGDSERQTLYVRALDELESLQLTGKEGTAAIELPYHPFFSPDGKWVGFVTTSELYKVQVNGGTPIKICEVERSRGATWLPDDSIVIASAHAGGLARVRANGGEPAPLTELDTSRREGSHRWPQALPGGDHILFTSHTASGNFDNAALEVVSLESGERKVVYQGGSYGRYAASGHLVFANGGTLFAVRFDPERHEVVGSPVPVLQDLAVNPSEGAAQFDFSSAGQLVYVTAGETDVFPIVWVDRAGRTEALWAEEGVYANPRLSPDGRRLSLTVLRDNNWDVWVHDLERGVPTRLTFGASVDSEQIWSPDGETLVFSSDQDGPDRLYRKRADGSGEVEALTETTGKPQWAQAWSRDGRYIATTEGDTEYDLWYLDLETRQMKEVLATEFGDGYPDFSPDGRWIVYASNESGSFQVYVRPFPEGHGKWQVSEAGGGNPRWSRSGKEIFWRTNSGIAVAEVDISGGTFRAGKPKILFEGAFQGGALGMSVGGFLFADYDVSPDGQRFVMFPNLRGERGSHQHITLVTHWFDDLERLTEGGAR
jgi:serine/threonine-protein kinase